MRQAAALDKQILKRSFNKDFDSWNNLDTASLVSPVTHDDALLLPTVSLFGVALIYDDMTALLK